MRKFVFLIPIFIAYAFLLGHNVVPHHHHHSVAEHDHAHHHTPDHHHHSGELPDFFDHFAHVTADDLIVHLPKKLESADPAKVIKLLCGLPPQEKALVSGFCHHSDHPPEPGENLYASRVIHFSSLRGPPALS